MDRIREMQTVWRGRRVFLTGHTGFKGAWMSLWLQLLETRLTGYSLEPPTNVNLFEMADVGSGMDDVRGDVRDLDALSAAMDAARPEFVFHLAAQALVRESYRRPVDTYATNVMGTVNILEAARQCPSVRVVVVVTSDKCYANAAGGPCREDDPMGGRDPYSSSKGCAELVTEAYRGSFHGPAGKAAASARAGPVIGGGDWAADRLITDCIRAIQSGEEIIIRNPDSVRPWQHVLEPLSGYLLLAEMLSQSPQEFAEGWNFGPDEDDAVPVRQIADRVVELWGDGARWVQDRKPGPYEAAVLRLDCAKARQRLGWRPRLDVDAALHWTIDWYRRVSGGENPRQLTCEQILQYVTPEPTAHDEP